MSTDQKADRYLTEGRVMVLSADRSTPMGTFQVAGSADQPYAVTFRPATGWDCDCPAQKTCAHILACRKITGFEPVRHALFADPADDLTQFLNS